jgi:hypothetical protein
MRMKTLITAALAAALTVATSTAFAQESQHMGRKSGGDAPAAMPTDRGAASSIPEGQGGTAGSHPTGANVGPNRAGQQKTPGE